MVFWDWFFEVFRYIKWAFYSRTQSQANHKMTPKQSREKRRSRRWALRDSERRRRRLLDLIDSRIFPDIIGRLPVEVSLSLYTDSPRELPRTLLPILAEQAFFKGERDRVQPQQFLDQGLRTPLLPPWGWRRKTETLEIDATAFMYHLGLPWEGPDGFYPCCRCCEATARVIHQGDLYFHCHQCGHRHNSVEWIAKKKSLRFPAALSWIEERALKAPLSDGQRAAILRGSAVRHCLEVGLDLYGAMLGRKRLPGGFGQHGLLHAEARKLVTQSPSPYPLAIPFVLGRLIDGQLSGLYFYRQWDSPVCLRRSLEFSTGQPVITSSPESEYCDWRKGLILCQDHDQALGIQIAMGGVPKERRKAVGLVNPKSNLTKLSDRVMLLDPEFKPKDLWNLI